jgi:Neutral/alkaline non-lysosomal ceramidase, N-terminal
MLNNRSSRTFKSGWLLLTAILASSTVCWSATLRAAVTKVDITPAPGAHLWGYSNRQSPATGTIDPLYARVLVLEAGSQSLALVNVDLGRTFGQASLQWLRDTTQNDASFLIVTATHTHSGPVIQDDYSGGKPAWETAALEKIARAVAEARKNLTDAQLGVGYGIAFIGHNRLRVNTDGTVSWFERNLTEIPTAPVDGMVSVLRIDRADGQPIAILVNYACHPVIFGSDNLQYSADFPGAMARTVEQAFGAKPLCFFLQGAAGDINPYFAVTPLEQDAIALRDQAGRTLGREAVRIAEEIHTKPEPTADLQFAQDLVSVRLRWDPQKWREAMIAVFGATGSEPFAPKLDDIQLPVTTVLINRRIAILSMPGEPFVEYQIAWRQRCPVRDALLVGYANGYKGYFPSIRSATLGGYGAANPATWVEVGAGDRMIDTGVTRIDWMLGRLHELPEDFAK